jgi:hypothetical protein
MNRIFIRGADYLLKTAVCQIESPGVRRRSPAARMNALRLLLGGVLLGRNWVRFVIPMRAAARQTRICKPVSGH